MPASTALSGIPCTGFGPASTALVRAAVGFSLSITALSGAAGTGFGPVSTALARRFIPLGAARTLASASPATPLSGETVGYQGPSRKQTGNAKSCQDFFELLSVHLTSPPFPVRPEIVLINFTE